MHIRQQVNLLKSTQTLIQFGRYALEAFNNIVVPLLAEDRVSHLAIASSAPPISDMSDNAGAYEITEMVYRKVFDGQQIDEDILPVLTADVFSKGETVADFGANVGGYASFFNRTGIVTAFAFDGAEGVASVTHGTVLQLRLDEPFTLWRTFDWVFCLEVLEHIPAEFEQTALENLYRHARKGAVVSWAPRASVIANPSHVNAKDEPEVRAALAHWGFRIDESLTTKLRKATRVYWLEDNIAVYRLGEHSAS